MKTLKFTFKSNGEDVKLTAIVSDDLSTLSTSKKNQATDIIDDFIEDDNTWSLFFEITPSLGYEIQLKVNENKQKTLIPVKAITWEGSEDDSVITDVQKVKINNNSK